jgi:hypothetical protein
MQDKAILLYEWRQLRLKLQNKFTKSTLQKIVNWWKDFPYHNNGFNYDDITTFPDVWEYISEEFYTNSGNGLGCFYTAYHAHPDKNPELWLILDLTQQGEIYLVAYVDGYVLNRLHGKVDKYEDVKDDIDIMERITYEDIEPHLKDRK